ncbi:MAG: LysM peptidoglycan-binding domain-containing protein [Elusimicrobiota bacterium]
MRITAIKNYKLKIKNCGLFLTFIFHFLFFIFHCLYSQQLQEIEVKAGDTLWGVANHYLKDPTRWREILDFNNISPDPNNVLPGMKLKIPVKMIKESLRTSTVVSIIREVKVRRQTEIDWNDARMNMKLFNKDGIRTFENSFAGVKSPLGNHMTIGPSSLVIVQPEEKTDETRLLAGEIRTSNIPVRTPTAVIVPKITPKTPLTDYKAKVKEDQSTIVAVYKGAVDVTAKNKTVTVPEGFSTEVKINLPPLEPKLLPPSMELPEDQPIKIKEAGLPDIKTVPPTPVNEINIGGVGLGGQSKSGSSKWFDITHYHIQITKDKEFNEIVFDAVKPIHEKFDIKKTDVPDGKYFWRVAYLDSSGAEGIISSAKEILVDKTPPALTVNEPKNITRFTEKNIKITGISEPNALIDVNKNYTTCDDNGKFSLDYSLVRGENILNVNAKDPYGNIATTSIKVYWLGEGITRTKRSFFATPLGIVVAIVTISALTAISIITIGG